MGFLRIFLNFSEFPGFFKQGAQKSNKNIHFLKEWALVYLIY